MVDLQTALVVGVPGLLGGGAVPLARHVLDKRFPAGVTKGRFTKGAWDKPSTWVGVVGGGLALLGAALLAYFQPFASAPTVAVGLLGFGAPALGAGLLQGFDVGASAQRIGTPIRAAGAYSVGSPYGFASPPRPLGPSFSAPLRAPSPLVGQGVPYGHGSGAIRYA